MLKPQSHYSLRLLATTLRTLWTNEPTIAGYLLATKAMITNHWATILVAKGFLVQ